MASGKKNYFRHSFFARNDSFVCGLIEKFGLSGYYYFFALIEVCGELSAEELQEKHVFHKRTLIKSLRLNTRKLNLFLGYLQDTSRISYTYSQHTYIIIFPKLAKYLGRYTGKKGKVKESKVKESKVKEKKPIDMTFENQIDKIYTEHYPKKQGKKKGIERLVKIITTKEKLKGFEQSVVNYKKQMTLDNTERKYIKHFSTFANEYEDWINHAAEDSSQSIGDEEAHKQLKNF